jgi:hypothetical protein
MNVKKVEVEVNTTCVTDEIAFLEHITTPHFLTKYDQYVNMFVYLC